jgi:transposase
METEFAAFVAIDWADQKHAWMLQVQESSDREAGTIDHTPEAVDVWAAELGLRFGGQRVAVALEQSRGPLVFMLAKYEQLVIFPVHPTTLANYRKSFRPSGAKDDPSDAGLLLDVLTLHRDKLRRLNPGHTGNADTTVPGGGASQSGYEKTRYSNRLTSHLKMYFPQTLEWFDEIGSHIAAEFLERWPTLEKLQRARPATIERLFIDHNSRDAERIAERLGQIRKAVPATTDMAVLVSCSTAVVAWAGLLKQLLAAITAYDEKIDMLAREHPDYTLMKSFPGAGPALTPRLIAALGSQRDRYETAFEIQCYSGIAPVVASSGKQRWVHWRWSCPKFLRQTFHEWALPSIALSQWAREYYDEQRAKGKRRNSLIGRLGNDPIYGVVTGILQHGFGPSRNWRDASWTSFQKAILCHSMTPSKCVTGQTVQKMPCFRLKILLIASWSRSGKDDDNHCLFRKEYTLVHI